MKRHIISFFAFLLLASPLANAQSLKEGEYTVNGVLYRVHESKEYSHFGIQRKNKPYIPENKETINGLPSYYVKPVPTNEAVWHQLVLNVLGSQRIAALKQNKDRLRITFYCKPNGEIYYMRLNVRKHSIFTLQEVVKIEQELLQKYKATLKSDNNEHLQLSWTGITSELDFSKL